MAPEFANDPIEVEGLPRLDDADFVGVDPRYATPSLVGTIGFAVVAMLVAVGIATRVDRPLVPTLIGAAVALTCVISLVITLIERRVAAYLLRDHDVSFRSGVITRSVATIPLARVQHVAVQRGALEQLLGLATLEVSSAGPDLSIPGLHPDEAERLKQYIIEHSDAATDAAGDGADGTMTEAASTTDETSPSRELPPPAVP